MDLKTEQTDDIHIVRISGDLDMYNTMKLKEAVQELVDRGISKLVLDMEHVEYLDSSGVGTLIFIYNTAQKKNIAFLIGSLGEQPFKVLELTKLTAFFPFADGMDDALAKLAESDPKPSGEPE